LHTKIATPKFLKSNFLTHDLKAIILFTKEHADLHIIS